MRKSGTKKQRGGRKRGGRIMAQVYIRSQNKEALYVFNNFQGIEYKHYRKSQIQKVETHRADTLLISV